MFARVRVTFLLDFDNTLSDNDLARERLTRATLQMLGADASRDFWTTYERVRDEMGFVDFMGTLERFDAAHPEVAAVLDRAVLDFQYAEVLYPDSLRTLAALWRVGVPVVLSDGDRTYQPLKISRSGVHDAVRGNVLVFPHKEHYLDVVARLFPADRYVAVDDKAVTLARVKVHWGERVATVHVLQGKYSDDPYDGPRPDATIAAIGDLVGLAGTPDALRVLVEGASIRDRSH
jgi:FMN phosphatase YigB (HAD superfamily)